MICVIVLVPNSGKSITKYKLVIRLKVTKNGFISDSIIKIMLICSNSVV